MRIPLMWRRVLDEGVRNVKDYSGFLSFLPTGTTTTAVYLTPLAPDDGTGGDEDDRVKTVGIARFAPMAARSTGRLSIRTRAPAAVRTSPTPRAGRSRCIVTTRLVRSATSRSCAT